MKPRIALEEHFLAPGFEPYFAGTRANIKAELYDRAVSALTDFGERRLAAMNQAGVTRAVLSLSGPGVQMEPDAATATNRARAANDFLASKVQARPDRYAGFAHLAMQDPRGAADELERCMTQLGFCGAMVNGQTGGLYLDDDRYSAFWERAAALGAPIYIHPHNPVDQPAMYDRHPELWGPVWSWTVETASHALRLVFAGVFDRFTDARIILGHMGETLPYQLWRFDSRWEICNRGDYRLALPPSAYLKRNLWVTTSGVCSDEALACALSALGRDHVMFSIDYPFESAAASGAWLDAAPLDAADHEAVSYGNAAALLRL